MDLELPEGFKFDPTDQQLLNKYLRAKICGERLPCDLIREKEIYGPNANPWEIFNDPSTPWIISNNSEKVVYVFVHLTKMATTSSGGGEEHYVKKAGCGTWHVETPRMPVMEGEKFLGTKRMLIFKINDINNLGDGFDYDKVGYWKMHEYFLHGCKDYVVCRITFDRSKRAKVDPNKSKAKAVSGSIKSSKTKVVSGITNSSKANKKVTSIPTAKDDKGKAVLVKSSCIFRNLEKELVPNHDLMRIVTLNNVIDGGGECSYGSCYDQNQICHEENNGMMIYQNPLDSMNSISRYGSDQGLIINIGLPQYDDRGSFRVREQEGQGLALNDVGQRLYYEEEEAQPICSGGDFEDPDKLISEFNSEFNDVYLDLEDLFGDGSSEDNVLQEQSISRDNDVSFNLEKFFDIGSQSEKNMENFHGQVNNNVEEQEQHQQHMQNRSCMLGKRQLFEAQEDYSGPTKKPCI